MSVDEIIDEIIDKEKGYVNHPADRGGPTKYGITQKTLSAWRGRHCTASDVKNLKKTEAKQIYKSMYFYRTNIHLLPKEIQPIMLDMAVNHGQSRAIKLLQQIIDVEDDGIIGQKTIDEAKSDILSLGAKVVIGWLVARRIRFYEDIVNNDRTQAVFLDGWLTRAKSFIA